MATSITNRQRGLWPDPHEELDDGFGHWLAGFVAGEGSFLILRQVRMRKQGLKGAGLVCTFRIALHVNDEPILREAQRRTGLGKVWVGHSPSQTSPCAIWVVQKKADCRKLAEIFQRYPLRAKKARDFDIWCRALDAWALVKGGRENDWSTMEALRIELSEGRPRRGRLPDLKAVA